MYNAQLFEGKIRCTLHMGIMIIYHGYNNHVYDAHKNTEAHYMWQSKVFA